MCRAVFNYFCTFVPKISVSLHSVVAITAAGAKPTTSIRLVVLFLSTKCKDDHSF